MARRTFLVLHASAERTDKLPPLPVEVSLESAPPPPYSRKIPHAAISYLLAAAVALLAIRLGTPAPRPVAQLPANAQRALSADLQGAAAASFCRLLLDKADENLSGLPTVTVMATPPDDEHPGYLSKVEQMSPIEFARRLRQGPLRELDNHPPAVSLTQHCPYRGRSCYCFRLDSRSIDGAKLVEILIDEATQQPVGCRYLAAEDCSALCSVVHEWTVAHDVAGRTATSVQR